MGLSSVYRLPEQYSDNDGNCLARAAASTVKHCRLGTTKQQAPLHNPASEQAEHVRDVAADVSSATRAKAQETKEVAQERARQVSACIIL